LGRNVLLPEAGCSIEDTVARELKASNDVTARGTVTLGGNRQDGRRNDDCRKSVAVEPCNHGSTVVSGEAVRRRPSLLSDSRNAVLKIVI
jgi:hypothetical protein